MSSFTTPLVVKANDDGTWTLKEAFEYCLESLGSGKKIVVEKSYVTDFASVPRVFWAIYPPYSPKYGKASVVHDASYDAELFDREKCDKIFKEAMKVLGANIITRNLIYSAVRMFGVFVWKAHTKKSIEEARKLAKYVE